VAEQAYTEPEPNEKENPLNSRSRDDLPRNEPAPESPYPNAKDVPEGTLDVEAITDRFTLEQKVQVCPLVRREAHRRMHGPPNYPRQLLLFFPSSVWPVADVL
jgi:hypothetical protein